MTPYEIPFEARAQTFAIALAGVTYQLSTAWNSVSQCWVLNIAQADGTPLVNGIAIVPGVDLLKQFGYLNFGGQVFVQSVGDVTTIPNYDSLGSTGLVFFVVP